MILEIDLGSLANVEPHRRRRVDVATTRRSIFFLLYLLHARCRCSPALRVSARRPRAAVLAVERILRSWRVLAARDSRVAVLIRRLEPHDVVTPNQNLPERALTLTVDEFFRRGELEVHVRIRAHEKPAVLHAPLELDGHLLPGERREEGFWVDGRPAHRRRRSGVDESAVDCGDTPRGGMP